MDTWKYTIELTGFYGEVKLTHDLSCAKSGISYGDSKRQQLLKSAIDAYQAMASARKENHND